MAEDITPRQREVLRLIFTGARQGMAPTNRDVCVALGIGSINAVVQHVKALMKKGAVTKVPNVARGLLITPVGLRMLGEGP